MSAATKPREERKRIVLNARLRIRGATCEARICDASSRGLSMTAAQSPPRGEIVEVVVGRTVLVGQVRWSRASRFGVVLQDRIDVAALRHGALVSQSSTARAQAAQPAQGFAFHDKLFLWACVLAGAVFLIHALRNWV